MYIQVVECLPPNSVAVCSEGYFKAAAVDSTGHEIAVSDPVYSAGAGYTVIPLPTPPGAVTFNLYKSDDPGGSFTLYASGFDANAIEACAPGCFRVSSITLDGETVLSDPACADLDYIAAHELVDL